MIFSEKRKVIDEPTIVGKKESIEVGFVLFMENNTLTLECHDWGNDNIDENIRQENLAIEIIKL